jgi:DNA polymerase-3 subunit delta'
VPFGPLPEPFVAARLERDGVPAPDARLAAALSGGSLGRALQLEGDEVQAVRASLAAAVALSADEPLGWLAFARSLGRVDAKGRESEDGSDREEVAGLGEALLAWWRDVLVVQAGGADLAFADLAAETRRAAGALAPAEVLRRRGLVERLLAALRQNAAGPLAVERMLIGWFHGR